MGIKLNKDRKYTVQVHKTRRQLIEAALDHRDWELYDTYWGIILDNLETEQEYLERNEKGLTVD